MIEQSLPEESIFLQALDCESAAERAAYLGQACSDNLKLRAEVEALLRATKNRATYWISLNCPVKRWIGPSKKHLEPSSARISSCSKSAKVAWVSCSWPSRPSRFSGPSR